jgi:hypothetical protein
VDATVAGCWGTLEIASGADGIIDSTSAFEREWGWKGDGLKLRELSVAWREGHRKGQAGIGMTSDLMGRDGVRHAV